MIRMGHANCLEYPVGMFHAAVRELEKAHGDD